MTSNTPQLRAYTREDVAQLLEQINELIDRFPERHPLSPGARAMWAGFPAQARAHRYPQILLDPYHPIVDYMRSGRIGPNYDPAKTVTPEQACK